jgi:hypothetical protein
MEEATVVKCEPDLNNPWAVKQLEDFLFYCCPECSDRSQTKETFINHALFQHPLARVTIPAIEAENIPLFDLPKNHNDIAIKTELTTEETYDVSNEEMDEIGNGSDSDNFDPLSGISTKKRKRAVNDDDYSDNESSDDNANSQMCIYVSEDQPVKEKMEELYRINEENKFECLRCLKIVTSVTNMQQHLKSHTNCSRCGRFFSGRQASGHLKQHEKICRGPKKRQCQYCAKSFKLTWMVKRHEKGCRDYRPS